VNFELNEMQTLLKNSVAHWTAKNYGFEARSRLVNEGEGFSEAHWSAFVEFGWLGASLAEEDGGYGGGPIEAAIIMEEFGKALVTEPFFAIGVLTAQTLIGMGGEASIALVQAIQAGETRAVLAHTEAAARGDVGCVSSTARQTGTGWSINGTKAMVWGGPFADQFIVSARSFGATRDRKGISLFLVPADAPGLYRRNARLSDGSRAAALSFTDVSIPHDALLGTEGGAFDALARGQAHGIVALCAEAVGAMDRVLWMTRDHLLMRMQFKQPIGNFQALQHRMADMLIELELSRSALYRALSRLGSPVDERDHAVSLAKVQIGKAAKFVGGQAIQLHGAIGVTEECAVGHYFRRLTLIDNSFGSVQSHLQRIAAHF
jgi:alkylation response protein AidB-like acyl-CoA dehydrogenase